jgi:hypothetical protein
MIESRYDIMQHDFFKSWVEGWGAQLRIEKKNLVKKRDSEEYLAERVQEVLSVPVW